jgi:hypothetical protein
MRFDHRFEFGAPDVRELQRALTIRACRGLVDWWTSAPLRGAMGWVDSSPENFGHLETGKQVVHPMHTQSQLLIDAALVGARRVFDFEWLANDPLFEHLVGGAVPSVDALYDDLTFGMSKPRAEAWFFDGHQARRRPSMPSASRIRQSALKRDAVATRRRRL